MVEPIVASFERALRSLLWRLEPGNLQQGVELSIRRALGTSGVDHDQQRSLQHVYSLAREQTIQVLLRRREARRSIESLANVTSLRRSSMQTLTLLEEAIPPTPLSESPDFHCDSGLGGLARWLRAAGHDARFWPHIDDAELIRQTIGTTAILLTTDQPLMMRSAVSWKVVPALLVPLSIGKRAQFQFVRQRLCLPKNEPRCMACGGSLRRVEKELVRDRIPPRTYPWRDEYFECNRCQKLFWQGTHWQNVEQQLRAP